MSAYLEEDFLVVLHNILVVRVQQCTSNFLPIRWFVGSDDHSGILDHDLERTELGGLVWKVVLVW